MSIEELGTRAGKAAKPVAKTVTPIKVPVSVPVKVPATIKDKISVARIEKLHPARVEEVKGLIIKAESVISQRLAIRVVQGLRTWAQQEALYAQGRTRPGKIVTNAKPGSSFHEYGCAVDFCFVLDSKTISWDTLKDYDGDLISDWLEVVQIFIKAGYTWGGNFKSIRDMPHFEKSNGYKVSQLREKYKKKDFIKGTQYVNI